MPCSSVCPEPVGPDGFCEPHRPPGTAWWPRGAIPPRKSVGADALGRFTRWLRYGGATFEALEVADGPDGERHVRMRRPVAAGEPILVVPRRLVLTDDHVNASPVGQALEEAGVDLQSPHSSLAAFLLAERMSPVAPWGPYVDVLPATYRNLPMFWDAATLALLRGAYIARYVDGRRAALLADYARLQTVPMFAATTCLEYLWAMSAVSTRAFGVDVAGRSIEALVPMADMMNHQAPHDTEWRFDDEADAFTMTASTALGAHAEVHDSYGAKCNGRYLLNYGFCLEPNPHNTAELVFAAGDEAGAEHARAAGAVEVGDGVARFRVTGALEAKDTGRALAFLRATGFDERGVRDALAVACDQALARFDPEPPAEAEEPRARLCAIVRRGEQAVLTQLRCRLRTT